MSESSSSSWTPGDIASLCRSEYEDLKTPVSLLYEKCQKLAAQLDFSYSQEVDSQNLGERLFKCSAQIKFSSGKTLNESDTGRSKRNAKQNVAHLLLSRIKEMDDSRFESEEVGREVNTAYADFKKLTTIEDCAQTDELDEILVEGYMEGENGLCLKIKFPNDYSKMNIELLSKCSLVKRLHIVKKWTGPMINALKLMSRQAIAQVDDFQALANDLFAEQNLKLDFKLLKTENDDSFASFCLMEVLPRSVGKKWNMEDLIHFTESGSGDDDYKAIQDAAKKLVNVVWTILHSNFNID